MVIHSYAQSYEIKSKSKSEEEYDDSPLALLASPFLIFLITYTLYLGVASDVIGHRS
jgi:hypothetical protein